MRDLINTIFKSSEERIKNPFIGAFIISWCIFNWKSILIILFSSQTIETKIIYVELLYHNWLYLIIFPLVAALFYVLLLPYLNLLADKLLQQATVSHGKHLTKLQLLDIKNRSEITLAEIQLQEEETSFREREAHNTLIQDLQNNIKQLESEVSEKRRQNDELHKKFKEEMDKRMEIFSSERHNFEQMQHKYQQDIAILRNDNYKKEEQIKKLQSDDSIHGSWNKSILEFSNGEKVVEDLSGDIPYYYNDRSKRKYTKEEFEELKRNSYYERYMFDESLLD